MKEGRLTKFGRINVLELRGDYRSMGRQYGRLLKDQLNEFYENAIEKHFMKEERMPYLRLLAIARLLFRRYPKEFKEMLAGMSEASGISSNALIMLDQVTIFEFVRYQNIGRCSNIAAWGDYAADGALVLGRNFDQPAYFRKFNEFITLAVFSPDDGGIPTANIGYAGQLGINTAMNEYGIFIANNEVLISKADVIDIKAPSILIAEFEFLTRSSDLKGLDDLMKGARANCPIMVSVADKRTAYSYEWTGSTLKRRSESENGLTVTTNHFIDPSWGRPEPFPDVAERTVERRRNLLSLGQRHKGAFNARKMMELLDITVDKGGATHFNKTIFQIVAVPQELKFYVKIPDFQDWTEVNLGNLFNGPAA